MFGNEGLMDKLKSFDVYRKLPKDYLKPTFIGAVRKDHNYFLKNEILFPFPFSLRNCYDINGDSFFQ